MENSRRYFRWVLLALLIAVVAGAAALCYRIFRTSIDAESISPDGEYRCVVASKGVFAVNVTITVSKRDGQGWKQIDQQRLEYHDSWAPGYYSIDWDYDAQFASKAVKVIAGGENGPEVVFQYQVPAPKQPTTVP